MELINANEASHMLGVSRQTLMNWVQRGVIPSYTRIGQRGFYWFKPEDIDKYRETLLDIHFSENNLAQYKRELKDKEGSYESRLRLLKNYHKNTRARKEKDAILVGCLTNFLKAIENTNLYELKYRERDIVLDILNDVPMSEMSVKYGLTRQRILQLAEKARIMIEGVGERIAQLDSMEALNEENKMLRTELNNLKTTKDAPEHISLFSLAKKHNCSARLLNVLKWYDYYQVRDALTMSKRDIKGIRGMGEKTKTELRELLHSQGYHVRW